MPNMSYCRFENTFDDLRDCLFALENNETLSHGERRKAIAMVNLCRQYIETAEKVFEESEIDDYYERD